MRWFRNFWRRAWASCSPGGQSRLNRRVSSGVRDLFGGALGRVVVKREGKLFRVEGGLGRGGGNVESSSGFVWRWDSQARWKGL